MYHYFDDVRTPQGPVLAGFYVRLVDSTTGETASLYADESETPIITLSGIADAALVDGDGNVDLYVAAGTYHLDYYAPDGVTFVKRVRNIPMTQNIFDTGNVVTATDAGFGYSAGNGGTVTQLTSKSTGVTLNALCGQITMNNATLVADLSVAFAMTNNKIAATDVVVVNIASGVSDAASYGVWVCTVGDGFCEIVVRNLSGTNKSEAAVISFFVLKSQTA